MLRTSVTTAFLAAAKLVSGHGGGQYYDIDGVTYIGNWDLLNNTVGSIQRAWNWNGFFRPDDVMACGDNGLPNANSMYAPIEAGHTIVINYTTFKYESDSTPGEPWTFGHFIGPMLAYLAACPEEGCESVDLSAPIWFKIQEKGLISGTMPEGYWAMRDVWLGANWDLPIPASLKPGKYLMRHEMINLQSGGIQLFPNCIQLEVSGEGNSLPAPGDLVAFPGGYRKDAEISYSLEHGSEWIYTMMENVTEYHIPGPPVWQG